MGNLLFHLFPDHLFMCRQDLMKPPIGYPRNGTAGTRFGNSSINDVSFFQSEFDGGIRRVGKAALAISHKQKIDVWLMHTLICGVQVCKYT